MPGLNGLQSHLPAFIRFAKGLYEDYDAVKAGMTLPWVMVLLKGKSTA